VLIDDYLGNCVAAGKSERMERKRIDRGEAVQANASSLGKKLEPKKLPNLALLWH
jgi:hypothetical protein